MPEAAPVPRGKVPPLHRTGGADRDAWRAVEARGGERLARHGHRHRRTPGAASGIVVRPKPPPTRKARATKPPVVADRWGTTIAPGRSDRRASKLMTRGRPWAVHRHNGADSALGQCRQPTGRHRLGPVAKAVGGGLPRAALGRESESRGGRFGRGLARGTPLVDPLDTGRVVACQDAPGRRDHRRGRRASAKRSSDDVGLPQDPRGLESSRRPDRGARRSPAEMAAGIRQRRSPSPGWVRGRAEAGPETVVTDIARALPPRGRRSHEGFGLPEISRPTAIRRPDLQ